MIVKVIPKAMDTQFRVKMCLRMVETVLSWKNTHFDYGRPCSRLLNLLFSLPRQQICSAFILVVCKGVEGDG